MVKAASSQEHLAPPPAVSSLSGILYTKILRDDVKFRVIGVAGAATGDRHRPAENHRHRSRPRKPHPSRNNLKGMGVPIFAADPSPSARSQSPPSRILRTTFCTRSGLALAFPRSDFRASSTIIFSGAGGYQRGYWSRTTTVLSEDLRVKGPPQKTFYRSDMTGLSVSLLKLNPTRVQDDFPC